MTGKQEKSCRKIIATFLPAACQMLYKPTTMTNKLLYIICTVVTVTLSTAAHAQVDTLKMIERDGTTSIRIVDPNNKILPDKLFEFGIPLLLIFMVLNTIITVFRIKAETSLKARALDKGISEGTLIELFKEDKQM